MPLINTESSFAPENTVATKIPLEHGFTGLPLQGKDETWEEKHILSPQIKPN